MDRCLSCQYFDRRNARSKDAKSTQWGQCRRSAPMLSPQSAKPHMIEGVWPHVRDDDWCGEYRAGSARRTDSRPAETFAPGPLIPIAGGAFGGRNGSVSPLQSTGSHPASPSLGSFISSGRGD